MKDLDGDFKKHLSFWFFIKGKYGKYSELKNEYDRFELSCFVGDIWLVVNIDTDRVVREVGWIVKVA